MVKISKELFDKYKTLVFVESRDINDHYPSNIVYFVNTPKLTRIFHFNSSQNLSERRENREHAELELISLIWNAYHNLSTYKSRRWLLYGSTTSLDLSGKYANRDEYYSAATIKRYYRDYKVLLDSKKDKVKDVLPDGVFKSYMKSLYEPYTKEQIKNRKIKVKRV